MLAAGTGFSRFGSAPPAPDSVPERREVRVEHGVQESVIVDARRAHHFTELQTAQAGTDNIVSAHAGQRGQVHALDGVKLGRDDAWADDLDPDTGARARR